MSELHQRFGKRKRMEDGGHSDSRKSRHHFVLEFLKLRDFTRNRQIYLVRIINLVDEDAALVGAHLETFAIRHCISIVLLKKKTILTNCGCSSMFKVESLEQSLGKRLYALLRVNHAPRSAVLKQCSSRILTMTAGSLPAR